MANKTVQIIISAKNDASKVINQVQKDLKSLQPGQSYGLGNVMGLLGKTAVFAVAAKAIGEVVNSINNLSQAGAQFERLETAADNLGAQYSMTSRDIIQSVDNIAQGTLSQKTILEQANKAMLLGVANSKEEFETLTKIAIDRGRAMGITMEHAFNSIILGVGRLSPLILDNLGIILDADKTYLDYAKSIGKTVDALSDAEKRQAVIARLKKEMGDFDESSVLDSASSWERLNAEVSNFNENLGTYINQVLGFDHVVRALGDSIRYVNEGLEYHTQPPLLKELDDLISTQKIFNNLIDSSIQGYEVLFSKKFDENATGLVGTEKNEHENILLLLEQEKKLNTDIYSLQLNIQRIEADRMLAKQKVVEEEQENADETNRVKILTERLNDLTSDLGNYYKWTTTETELWGKELITAEGSLEKAVWKAQQLVEGMNAAKEAASALNSAMGGAFSSLQASALEAYKNSNFNSAILTHYETQYDYLKTINEILKDSGMEQHLIAFEVARVTDGITDSFDAYNQQFELIKKSGSSTRSLTEEFSNLKSIVSGIFSNLYSDIGGVDLEDFLPREDAPNEAARRIADVMVKGFESPWASYFQNEFPILFKEYTGRSGGDVKLAASLLLKDFQSGLRPELIDLDIVKKLAKDMFRVDTQTKSMIDQVATELASELGISIEQATGYASQAAGGGSSLLSKNALEKTNDSLKFIPKWDLSNAKKDLIDTGKSVGLIDEAGKILIDTAVKVTSFFLPVDKIPDVNLLGKIDLVKSSEEISDTITASVGWVPVKVYIDYSTINQGIAASELIKLAIGDITLPTFLAIPTTESVNVFMSNIISTVGAIGIPLTVSMTENTDQINQALADLFNYISPSIPQFANGIAFLFSEDLLDSMAEQSENLKLVGYDLGYYILSGLFENSLGALIASELSRQIDEAQASFQNSGRNAGRKWGNGFLEVVGDNVPIELLDILTSLITPKVIAQLASQKNR